MHQQETTPLVQYHSRQHEMDHMKNEINIYFMEKHYVSITQIHVTVMCPDTSIESLILHNHYSSHLWFAY